jgi:hypothetical protein
MWSGCIIKPSSAEKLKLLLFPLFGEEDKQGEKGLRIRDDQFFGSLGQGTKTFPEDSVVGQRNVTDRILGPARPACT